MNGGAGTFRALRQPFTLRQATTEQVVRTIATVAYDGVIGLIPCDSGRRDWSRKFWATAALGKCAATARVVSRVTSSAWGGVQETTFETIAGVIAASSAATPRPRMNDWNLQVPLQSTTIHSINTGAARRHLCA